MLKRCSGKSINDFGKEVHLSTKAILGDMEEISKDDKMFFAIVEKGTKRLMSTMKYPCLIKMEICSYPTIRNKPSGECSN